MKKLVWGTFSGILAVIILVLSKNSLASLPVFTESTPVSLPILMYHSVLKDPQRTGKYTITPKKLEEDIIYLKNNGYETVSLKQVVRYVYQGEPLPDKPVLLTFDDGMYNNLEYVLPILEKHDACALFAVVGSYTDEYSQSGITNPNYSYLKWCDINRLMATERVEFASHSYNLHGISAKRYGTAKNKGESSLDFIAIFHEDTQKMQSAFKTNCIFAPFAYVYPLGNFSAESERVLKKNGFLASFSCIEGINIITRNDPDCLFLLKRYNRDGRLTTENFFKKIM